MVTTTITAAALHIVVVAADSDLGQNASGVGVVIVEQSPPVTGSVQVQGRRVCESMHVQRESHSMANCSKHAEKVTA